MKLHRALFASIALLLLLSSFFIALSSAEILDIDGCLVNTDIFYDHEIEYEITKCRAKARLAAASIMITPQPQPRAVSNEPVATPASVAASPSPPSPSPLPSSSPTPSCPQTSASSRSLQDEDVSNTSRSKTPSSSPSSLAQDDSHTHHDRQQLRANGHLHHKQQRKDDHEGRIDIIPIVQHVTEPVIMVPETKQDEAKPQPVKLQTQTAKTEPRAVEAQPQAQDIEAQPQTIEAKPQAIEAQPQAAEAQPQPVKTTPVEAIKETVRTAEAETVIAERKQESHPTAADVLPSSSFLMKTICSLALGGAASVLWLYFKQTHEIKRLKRSLHSCRKELDELRDQNTALLLSLDSDNKEFAQTILQSEEEHLIQEASLEEANQQSIQDLERRISQLEEQNSDQQKLLETANQLLTQKTSQLEEMEKRNQELLHIRGKMEQPQPALWLPAAPSQFLQPNSANVDANREIASQEPGSSAAVLVEHFHQVETEVGDNAQPAAAAIAPAINPVAESNIGDPNEE